MNEVKKTAGTVVVKVKATGIQDCVKALDELAEAVKRVNLLLGELCQTSGINITVTRDDSDIG